MTKEEKAKELGQMYFPDSDNIWARGNIEAHAVESACMDMAAFVEQQFEANRLSASERQTQEEDKRKMNRIYSILGQAADTHAYSTTCRLIGDKECIELQDFLKALKERVGCEVNCTTTREWSEEDDQYLLVCKNALEKYQTTDKWDAKIISRWLEDKLKSLRPQTIWKPSEEQMIAIQESIGIVGELTPRGECLKGVDLEKELKYYCNNYYNCDYPKQLEEATCSEVMPHIVSAAKHFFELGMRVNNPVTAADRGMAEEIIINLKRIEKDYRIDLTKEIEWVRNQVKKGE